ncbi:ferrous iron transport protein B [mine drainage metagenome]|uniref:Ferrous iron transport protein B n=1 Tax=mine drainage metagenome TaxID=410659 RepID=A0A1J5RWB1_9ZZZZ
MRKVALLGMPNTGKSTLFNRLTGSGARVGNWPGVTVELASAKLLLGAEMVEVVDLPGIYDLHGFSEDELVVRHFLENNSLDLAVVILNAVQIERQLALALQIQALGLPLVLLLNMEDEARKLGIRIDTEKISGQLAIPTVLISAKYGLGHQTALRTITTALRGAPATPIEAVKSALIPDQTIEAKLARVLAAAVDMPVTMSVSLTDRIDRLVLHPVLALPLFLAVILLLFQAVFALGMPLQVAMNDAFNWMRQDLLSPLLAWAPPFVQGLLLDGVWNGATTVATFVPIIVLFFVFMAIVEDTGYLSRAAFLTDALMARLGLDGRSFVMILMGFGCNVPALMGTRIMRSRPLRLLSMLLIPLSLCSARLQVFLFIIAALFTSSQAPYVLLSLYLASVATAVATALIFRRHFPSTEPFVIELPPYRLPTVRQIVLRAWQEVRHFFVRATKFIIAGVVLVWLLTNLPAGVAVGGAASYAGWLGHAFQPLLSPLGIGDKLTVALIFGFVAKEVVIGSLAVIYATSGAALAGHLAQQLDWVQAYSFMLFTLVYTPCLSTVATIRAESRSLGFTAFAVAWPLLLAWLLSFSFYQGARLLGY